MKYKYIESGITAFPQNAKTAFCVNGGGNFYIRMLCATRQSDEQ